MLKVSYSHIITLLLLAFIVPELTGFVHYAKYSTGEVILLFVYFTIIAFCIKKGNDAFINLLRKKYFAKFTYLNKVVALTVASCLYALTVSAFLCWGRFYFFFSQFDQKVFYNLALFLAALFATQTLYSEVKFLYQKREQDSEKVNLLDNALSTAELTVLKNELDPHFIFNSLNALSYLIDHEPKKASLFNNRLALVYKYFLLSKHKKQVLLEEEIEFIQNYFYLLQIRHDDKIKLSITIPKEKYSATLVLPCALQILVENAIKHNSFTEADPLCISITMDDDFIYVKNRRCPCNVIKASTRIGLTNLRSRYKLLCNQPITIETGEDYFIVRLPLLKTA